MIAIFIGAYRERAKAALIIAEKRDQARARYRARFSRLRASARAR